MCSLNHLSIRLIYSNKARMSFPEHSTWKRECQKRGDVVRTWFKIRNETATIIIDDKETTRTDFEQLDFIRDLPPTVDLSPLKRIEVICEVHVGTDVEKDRKFADIWDALTRKNIRVSSIQLEDTIFGLLPRLAKTIIYPTSYLMFCKYLTTFHTIRELGFSEKTFDDQIRFHFKRMLTEVSEIRTKYYHSFYVLRGIKLNGASTPLSARIHQQMLNIAIKNCLTSITSTTSIQQNNMLSTNLTQHGFSTEEFPLLSIQGLDTFFSCTDSCVTMCRNLFIDEHRCIKLKFTSGSYEAIPFVVHFLEKSTKLREFHIFIPGVSAEIINVILRALITRTSNAPGLESLYIKCDNWDDVCSNSLEEFINTNHDLKNVKIEIFPLTEINGEQKQKWKRIVGSTRKIYVTVNNVAIM